jgi:hypothetical protein
VSSRTARAIQRNPVLKKTKKQKKRKEKKRKEKKRKENTNPNVSTHKIFHSPFSLFLKLLYMLGPKKKKKKKNTQKKKKKKKTEKKNKNKGEKIYNKKII